MRNTKIDWCDASWNPVSGCRHDCKYCYARQMAERFAADEEDRAHFGDKGKDGLHVLEEKVQWHCKDGKFRTCAYPFGFEPTLLRYKLDEPMGWKKPKNVFVGSMADLFGEWVPDEWIEEVFEACAKAPWHRYLFLTKNPDRYIELYEKGLLPDGKNMYYGTTITNENTAFFCSDIRNTFVSIEPILGNFSVSEISNTNWIIVGAETGNRLGKVIPKKEWIDNIVETCRNSNVPVFLKESLEPIMGELIQEYPWGKE